MSEELTWLPAWRIAALVASREVSPVEVTRHFLDRIAKLDPTLHVFANVDAEGALEQARRAEEQVAGGGPIGPLHGVPFAVMDMVKAKGMRSAPWKTDSVGRDSIPVERLRKAGAILLGTVATYFFEPGERPRNPWDTSREPGNSSRGSGSAVAAGMVPFSLGQDSGGSTRLPAAWNGVLGLHPTRGLIPYVDYDKASLMLIMSVGPLARDVRDCAIVTQVLAGPDGRDLNAIQDDPPNYLSNLEDGVAGLRFAWTDDFGWSSAVALDETPKVNATARTAAYNLRSLGAEVTITGEEWEPSWDALITLIAAFEPVNNAHLVKPSEFVELQAKLEKARGLDLEPPVPVPDLAAPSSEEYEAATALRDRVWQTTMRVLRENDILLSPTTPILPKTLDEWGLLGGGLVPTYGAHTGLFNLLGFPALTVPCGFVDGLPVGLQMITRPGREDLLFRAAKSYLDAFPQVTRPAVAV
ncbi:amidase [Streptomyces sp. CA-210063]|uniref:amidase n=1 Tax=Streptomyces sp. CA-210063 TaxID=2801029 RepID=UPI00214B411E|nr:amidase [Streptomyces sp. CA-210063]UUU29457.1 amidase [Streptomyces sp. CA-210063]